MNEQSKDMNEEKVTQRNTGSVPQAKPQTAPTEPNVSRPSQDAGWGHASTSQVVRIVVIALLSAVVVLGTLFLLWQVRTFIAWFVIALFLAAALNPAVKWLQRRHRLIKRPLAIALSYLGVLVALLFIAGIFLPLLRDQINGLIEFVVAAANAPEGPTEYIRALAQQNGLGGLFERLSDQIAALRDELGVLVRTFFASTGAIAVSAAGFVAALATVLTLTFFLLVGSERYVNAGVELFPAAHRPLVRRILEQSAGAVQRLHHGQPRHQRDLRRNHLCRACGPWYALCRSAGAARCGARLDTAGWRDAGWGAASHRWVVRRTMEGSGAAHLHRGLSASGVQHPPTDGLQSRCPAQCSGDLHRRSGRGDATRHPRRIAGHSCGRDHPDSSYRSGGLPARHTRSQQGPYRVAVTAHHLNAPLSCRVPPQEDTGSMGG